MTSQNVALLPPNNHHMLDFRYMYLLNIVCTKHDTHFHAIEKQKHISTSVAWVVAKVAI